MSIIEEITGHGKLTGFTLFEHFGRGWQMAVRPEGEGGWIVNIIPDDKAKEILAALESDPRFASIEYVKIKPQPKRLIGASLSGPFFGETDDADILLAQMKEAESALRALTAAIRARMPQ